MSNTRTAHDGEFHQERFCSATEFEGDVINGLAAAKRISIVKDRDTRELLWFVQWRSLRPAGLQQLKTDLLSRFPGRVLTKTAPKIAAAADFLDSPCVSSKASRRRKDDVQSCRNAARNAFADQLCDHLKRCCLDPDTDIHESPWYFVDLFGALKKVRDQSADEARQRLADTETTRQINNTLDFWASRRRMILIEGVAGIGRTKTTEAWKDTQVGMVRMIEVPSSGDDRSFFAAIARQLGVARGASMKAQEIKVRIEGMLMTSELMLVFDESQYLWGQYFRPRKTPDRILWIKTTFDAGTPIALIAHTDFSKSQALYVEKALWTDEQFERRLNRRVVLPTQHSREDMLKIAKSHFPEGDSRSLKLLAAYALGTEKKQASGIIEALESARYRAHLNAHSTVTFADVEAALVHDHKFLVAPPERSGPICKDVAKPLQSACRRPATSIRRSLNGGVRCGLPRPGIGQNHRHVSSCLE